MEKMPEAGSAAPAGPAFPCVIQKEVLIGEELNVHLRKSRAEPLSLAIILEKIASAVAAAIANRVLDAVAEKPLDAITSALSFLSSADRFAAEVLERLKRIEEQVEQINEFLNERLSEAVGEASLGALDEREFRRLRVGVGNELASWLVVSQAKLNSQQDGIADLEGLFIAVARLTDELTTLLNANNGRGYYAASHTVLAFLTRAAPVLLASRDFAVIHAQLVSFAEAIRQDLARFLDPNPTSRDSFLLTRDKLKAISKTADDWHQWFATGTPEVLVTYSRSVYKDFNNLSDLSDQSGLIVTEYMLWVNSYSMWNHDGSLRWQRLGRMKVVRYKAATEVSYPLTTIANDASVSIAPMWEPVTPYDQAQEHRLHALLERQSRLAVKSPPLLKELQTHIDHCADLAAIAASLAALPKARFVWPSNGQPTSVVTAPPPALPT